MGYEQIATSRGSPYWGFMTGCEGSKFPSAQGLFGGYSCPSYQLMKIKGINIFEELKQNPKVVEVFDIVDLMNKQPIKGGKYSSNDMGMTRSEEHTSELQSLMSISYAVFCLKKKKKNHIKLLND